MRLPILNFCACALLSQSMCLFPQWSRQQALAENFPQLRRCEILLHSSSEFNCIAWSLGICDEWIQPQRMDLDSFVKLNAQFGFQRSTLGDYQLEPGVDKIVLFGHTEGNYIYGTHQARQLPDGSWTSKLGTGMVIQFESPNELGSEIYGQPVAVFTRRSSIAATH